MERHMGEDAERLGRTLRKLAGVDENLMQQVWPARHSYTGLGGIVLGTALAGAASLLLAIALATDEFRWFYLLGPLLWGTLILNIDRWLVSSTHGHGGRLKIVPRLAIAILFGFVIAEPVVLWVFNDAIEARILDDRDEVVAGQITVLKYCNPEDSPELAAERRLEEDCNGAIVDVALPVFESAPRSATASPSAPATADGRRAALDSTRERLVADLKDTDDQIEALTQNIAELREQLNNEIDGVDTSTTSGRAGFGPRAEEITGQIERDDAEVESLRQVRGAQATELAEIEHALLQLATDQASAAAAEQERRDAAEQQAAEAAASAQAREDEQRAQFGAATSGAVAERIAEVRRLNSDDIGLLQRFDALSDLAADHSHIFWARWLLTALLVAVDSMPVLAKLIGGRSSYDRVYSEALSGAVAGYETAERSRLEDKARARSADDYERLLRRQVRRYELETEAVGQILGIDDQDADLHRSRDIAWQRPQIRFSDAGVSISRQSGASSGPSDRGWVARSNSGGEAETGNSDVRRESREEQRSGRLRSLRRRRGVSLDQTQRPATSISQSSGIGSDQGQFEDPSIDLTEPGSPPRVDSTAGSRAAVGERARTTVTRTNGGNGTAAWLEKLKESV